MWGYGRNQHSWMDYSKRISEFKIREVMNLLDEAYWLLEEDDEVLKDAEKPKKLDPKAAKEIIYKILEKMESDDWNDIGMNRLDHTVTDINWAVERIGSLHIDLNVTPKQG